MSPDRIADFARLVASSIEQCKGDEKGLLPRVVAAMRDLVATDDWLADCFTQPDPSRYRQFLLYADPADKFSVVSFVWGPGQQTPVHDHGTWGVIGMLRGAEITTSFSANDGAMRQGPELMLRPGDVTVVSPAAGDIHQVRNAYADRVSISIHVYGANIGKQVRHVFDPQSGERKTFVSGYSEPVDPVH